MSPPKKNDEKKALMGPMMSASWPASIYDQGRITYRAGRVSETDKALKAGRGFVMSLHDQNRLGDEVSMGVGMEAVDVYLRNS